MNKYPYYIEVPLSTDVNTKEVVEWTIFEVKDKEDEQFVNYCYKQIAKPKGKYNELEITYEVIQVFI